MNQRNPVLLIHGIDESSGSHEKMWRALEKGGWAVQSIDLVPNNARSGLEDLARQVDEFINKRFPPSTALDIVGFSMGGLVARYYLQRLGGEQRVNRLITISTPHRGTFLAYFRQNPGARQMRPGSEFLRELNEDLPILTPERFISIWSPMDLMIVPAFSSAIPGVTSVRVNVLAHALMTRDPRVLRLVMEILQRA